MTTSTGAVIENLSNRKLLAIFSTLLIALVVFFLLGALCAPQPSTSMEFTMVKCRDPDGGRKADNWFYIRPPHCDLIPDLEQFEPKYSDMRDIVFIAQMPHQRDGVSLEYSRWFQFLLGLLEVSIEYSEHFELVEDALIQLEIRLAYRTHADDPNTWHELITTNATRTLQCTPPEPRVDGHKYDCQAIDLFELGSNPYPFYLINLRLPVDQSICRHNAKGPNCAIGRIADLSVIAIHQNGGFTAIWLWMKTFVCPVVIVAIWWYWRRIAALNRYPFLLEKAIFVLGLCLAVLDFPLEWISLWFRVPFMLLLSDIRQGLFYAVLFSFWLIFAGEHLIDDTSRNNMASYWRNLTSVLVASLCFLIYDVAERGMQLSDPFFSIWASEFGTKLAYTVVYVASGCVVAYFAFLLYKIWQVWTTIKRKRAAQLYRNNENRRLKVEAIIYRFKFLMFFTLVCAAFTIVSYMMKQYGEGQIHGDSPEESVLVHSTSAFFTGTFGMWNIYVLSLLAMYAPSHKQYATANVLTDETEDLMEDRGGGGTATESAPMTTFLKAATD